MTREQQIEQRTQEIVKLQVGDLVVTCAALRATNEALRAELQAVTQNSKPEPPPHDTP